MSLTYDQIVTRLEAIERDLGERQQPYADAAEAYYRHLPKWGLEEAKAMLKVKGSTVTERKANAQELIALEQPEFYEEHIETQAAYEGQRAAIRVLEARSMVGMALLKSYTRESGPSPQWSAKAPA